MKKHFCRVVLIVGCILIILALAVRTVDPFLHYKNHFDGVSHYLPEPYARFINDGMARNYDYDSIITGTSMTQNFLPSQMDELFGVKTVKLTASGGNWKEINEIVKQAFLYNSNIKYVVRGLDLSAAIENKDDTHYDGLPEYLTDDNSFNDVNYLLDKRAMYICAMDIAYTIKGIPGTSMDEYCYWANTADWVPVEYEFDTVTHEQNALSDEEKELLLGNVRQNVTDIASEHPDTTFIYFICPYSICYFDSLETAGELDKYLEAEELIIRECNRYENIEIYSFFDREDIICDLSNYKDTGHYLENVNSYMLECFKSGEGRITLDDLSDYRAREVKLMKKTR